jgi:hypothetical protein
MSVPKTRTRCSWSRIEAVRSDSLSGLWPAAREEEWRPRPRWEAIWQGLYQASDSGNFVRGFEYDEQVTRPTVEERFWAKVDKNGPGGCWMWTAGTANTYGQFRVGGQRVQAHRFSYEMVHGEVALELVMDHLCRRHLCVNPEHLEPVSNEENVARGVEARGGLKTHCVHGHSLADAYVYKKGRKCRSCAAEAYQRRKAA